MWQMLMCVANASDKVASYGKRVESSNNSKRRALVTSCTIWLFAYNRTPATLDWRAQYRGINRTMKHLRSIRIDLNLMAWNRP